MVRCSTLITFAIPPCTHRHVQRSSASAEPGTGHRPHQFDRPHWIPAADGQRVWCQPGRREPSTPEGWSRINICATPVCLPACLGSMYVYGAPLLRTDLSVSTQQVEVSRPAHTTTCTGDASTRTKNHELLSFAAFLVHPARPRSVSDRTRQLGPSAEINGLHESVLCHRRPVQRCCFCFGSIAKLVYEHVRTSKTDARTDSSSDTGNIMAYSVLRRGLKMAHCSLSTSLLMRQRLAIQPSILGAPCATQKRSFSRILTCQEWMRLLLTNKGLFESIAPRGAGQPDI
ncbi:hypothetical protein J3F83DRAFT_625326 [Trichoderma novae-zelandiae]